MAMKDDELNTLIDDVARQMTAGEPGAAFTSSVLARLESEARRTRSWSPASAGLAGLAAAAVLFIATTIVFRSHRPTESAAPAVRLTPDIASASDVRLKPDVA